MEYRKFEQHIFNTLSKDEAALDINALILNIHGKRQKEKKWILLLFISVGLLGGLSSIYYFNQHDSSGDEKSGLVFINDIDDNKSNSTLSDDSAQLISSDETNVKGTANQATNQKSHDSEEASRLKEILIHKEQSELPKADPFKISNSTYNIGNKEKTSTIDILNKNHEIEHQNEFASREKFLNLNTLNFAFDPLKTNIGNNKNNINISTDKIICPSFSNRGKLYFQIIPEVGYFLPLKTLENRLGEVNNIFELRNLHEKSLEGLQASLFLQLRKEKSPFYIKSGISYSSLTERMKLQYSTTRLDTTQGIISITVSQTGDTITTIYGDIIRERKLSGQKTFHHSFSLIDIPLALGYEKKSEQWIFGVEAGILFNVSLKSDGYILASDTSFLDTNIPSGNFRPSLGLSYFGGISVARDFDHIGRLYLAARYRVIPTSFSGDLNRIKQSYHFAGIHLGYVYTF